MTCIVCPIGCLLKVEIDGENVSVAGNKCSRGEVYAKEELLAPKRVVTATCQTASEASSRAVQIDGINSMNDAVRRIPVKTTAPCPKEKIPELLNDIYQLKVTLPVKTGDILIKNWQNLELDIIATRTC